mmetsp:Transcript_48112/g.117862  ORF Transcript_48112/g.117862 Transcript_48112/m.117862 type:complete len:278 (+) Transcript_48112:322-1155(+)
MLFDAGDSPNTNVGSKRHLKVHTALSYILHHVVVVKYVQTVADTRSVLHVHGPAHTARCAAVTHFAAMDSNAKAGGSGTVELGRKDAVGESDLVIGKVNGDEIGTIGEHEVHVAARVVVGGEAIEDGNETDLDVLVGGARTTHAAHHGVVYLLQLHGVVAELNVAGRVAELEQHDVVVARVVLDHLERHALHHALVGEQLLQRAEPRHALGQACDGLDDAEVRARRRRHRRVVAVGRPHVGGQQLAKRREAHGAFEMTMQVHLAHRRHRRGRGGLTG